MKKDDTKGCSTSQKLLHKSRNGNYKIVTQEEVRSSSKSVTSFNLLFFVYLFELSRNEPGSKARLPIRHHAKISALTLNRTRHVCCRWRVNDRALLKLLKVKRLITKATLHSVHTKRRGEESLFYSDADKSVHCNVSRGDCSWSQQQLLS